MTGFRVALSGAQSYYGVTPDLTTLGKIIGGGMPVGAFGGKKRLWNTSPQPARFTKPAHSLATRLQWQPVWLA